HLLFQRGHAPDAARTAASHSEAELQGAEGARERSAQEERAAARTSSHAPASLGDSSKSGRRSARGVLSERLSQLLGAEGARSPDRSAFPGLAARYFARR